MANSWARLLPRVTVPCGTTPTRVTIVYPYYDNAAFLRKQFTHWSLLPADLRASLSIIVVDDGSPTMPAADALRGCVPNGFSLRLFRIDEDVPWNWLAARNIGAHHADTDWLLLTDMDHVVNGTTLRAVVFGQHDPSVIYAFERVEHTGEALAPHSASFLLTRQMFWTIGGYDEQISGHYGSDGDWRRRCAAAAHLAVLTDPLIRYEFVDDSSTTRYPRKRPADTAAVRAIVAARGPGWRPTTLSFPYHEVPCSAS